MERNLSHYNTVVTIDVLPDDALLEIFDFYLHEYQVQVRLSFSVSYHEVQDVKRRVESWQSLIHVCRWWRGLVFGSPRRLNLRLCCTPGKSARISLDIWPTLPLFIMSNGYTPRLKHANRVSQIFLICSTVEQIETVWEEMQVPFPELEVLHLSNALIGIDMVPVLPEPFLGGSAPRLRNLSFNTISFPGLPSLLLSATHLVNLSLLSIPHSGYISPEAMVTCLSMLTSLETLSLEFGFLPSPDQENRRSPPPTRSILPSLNIFEFTGVSEYLEDLVSWIDTPRLYQLSTAFFDDTDFDNPELNQFLIRTPTLGAYDEADLTFFRHQAIVSLRRFRPELSPDRRFEVKISYQVLDWQLSSMTQICAWSSRFFLTMENLCLWDNQFSAPYWIDDIENFEWLDLLRPFTAVKNLYLSEQFLSRIAPVLQELTVLPTLQNVFLEEFQPSEPVHENIAQFISARQLANHPVIISVWDNSPFVSAA